MLDVEQLQAVAGRTFFDPRGILGVVAIAGSGEFFEAFGDTMNFAGFETGEGCLDEIGAVEVPEAFFVLKQRKGGGVEMLGFGELAGFFALQIHAEGLPGAGEIRGVEQLAGGGSAIAGGGKGGGEMGIGEAEDGEFGGGVGVADGDGGEDAALRGGFRGVRGGG